MAPRVNSANRPDRGLNDRGKTVTKPGLLNLLGLASSEKQIPQVVENLKVEINEKKLWSGPLSVPGRRAPSFDTAAIRIIAVRRRNGREHTVRTFVRTFSLSHAKRRFTVPIQIKPSQSLTFFASHDSAEKSDS